MTLPTLSYANVRFGDTVKWQHIDGEYTGEVVGFQADICSAFGTMIPYMLVKCSWNIAPIKISMRSSYLEMVKMEIVDNGGDGQ